MTEIWVPYGPVEVSFDIKQENLSQVLDSQPQKMVQDDLERRVDEITEENVLLLSGTTGTQKFLESLLTRNKTIKKILYPKSLGALARRKAMESSVDQVLLNFESVSDFGSIDNLGSPLPSQLREIPRVVVLTSIHYDPLFGLSSAASDLISHLPKLRENAFRLSADSMPCSITGSEASAYSQRVAGLVPGLKVVEIVEKAGLGLLAASYGEPEPAHSKSLEYWIGNLRVELPNKVERIIFGCGGNENDKTLTDSLSRAFFSVVTGVAIPDSDSKFCMLAECSRGLGSDAFLQFVTGKLGPWARFDSLTYVEGLEVFISFQKTRQDFELNVLTTLPKFYASKFDMRTIAGARGAPSSLLQLGSRAKILVIPDASTCYFPT